jgi:predicted O-methyltransferase YrrM
MGLFGPTKPTKELTQPGLARMLEKVQGQISDAENFFLFTQAMHLKPGSTIVEIGSYRGKSTLALAFGARLSGSRVYSIDPHEHFTGAAGGVFGPPDLAVKIRNIAKFNLGDVIFPICMSSHDVGKIWNTPVDLCWIDGDHSYDGVKKDHQLFSVHVKKGGMLAFHDSEMEGVARLLKEVDAAVFKPADMIGSITAFIKIV